jgi:hypothetical protein
MQGRAERGDSVSPPALAPRSLTPFTPAESPATPPATRFCKSRISRERPSSTGPSGESDLEPSTGDASSTRPSFYSFPRYFLLRLATY